MGQHRPHGVTLVELVGRVRHKNDRKFQPLGQCTVMMETQPGRVCPPALWFSPPLWAAASIARISAGSPARPAPAAHAVKLSKILAAAHAVRQRPNGGKIAGAGQQLPEQLLHRQGAGEAAVLGQCLDKGGKPRLLSAKDRPVQTAVGPCTAQCNKGHLPCRGTSGSAARLPAEYLRRVVDNTQQRRKGSDMRLIKQIGGGLRKTRMPAVRSAPS